jgi:hypothetical protein
MELARLLSIGVVVGAFVDVGCATAVNDEDTSVDDTVDASDGATSVMPDGSISPAPDGGTAVDAAMAAHDDASAASDMVCQMRRTNGCIMCCQTDRMNGINAYVAIIQACVCGTNGPCATKCATEYCQNGGVNTPGDACDTCLNTALTGQCASQVSAGCAANVDCAGYLSCSNPC